MGGTSSEHDSLLLWDAVLKMETNFTIHFVDEDTVFRHLLADRAWVEIGRLGRSESWDGVALNVIRRRAARLSCGCIATILIADKELVRYTFLTPPHGDPEQTVSSIRRHLAMLTGQDVLRFAVDWTFDGQVARIAYVDTAELKQLEQFVTEFGFPVAGFAAIQDDREDFPPVLFLGTSEFGRIKAISEDSIRKALELPGHGAAFASRRTAAIAAAFLSGMLALSASSIYPGQAAATGGESGRAGAQILDSLSGSANSTGEPRNSGAVSSRITAVNGWQSAIAADAEGNHITISGRNEADRGFDPSALSFKLLDLAAVTAPEGHELFPAVPVFAPARTADDPGLQTASTAPGLEPAADTAPAAATVQPQPQQRPENRGGMPGPYYGHSAEADMKKDWKPLGINRPVLREGSRREIRVLAITRPVLRPGSRASETQPETATQEHQTAEERIRNAIRESLERDEEPAGGPDAEQRLKRPSRRPAQDAAAQSGSSSRTDPFRDSPPAAVDGRLNVSKTSLIGIYGESSRLRALVRLPSGKFKNLHVGGSFNGGTVVEITNSSVTYVKNGESIELLMQN